MRIAIIGSGIAGLGAAWCLHRGHDIDIFEAAAHVGGHANTVDVPTPTGPVPVDTGFIVYNERNYPNLIRLFAALGVPTQKSDMSFAVSIGAGSYEYAGDLRGFLAQPTNLLRRRLWQMLADIRRFYREAPPLKDDPRIVDMTIGDFLHQRGYSKAFTYDHLVPMAAAIWSSTATAILDFPLASFLRFFDNHGLLQVAPRPQWRTVTGGSREYVKRLTAPLVGRIHLESPVVAVVRDEAGVAVHTSGGGGYRFDAVVFATHADRTLRILGDGADGQERKILSAFRYETNRAVLHGDARLMPRRRGVWASWNYLARQETDFGRKVAVTYWMNRLQQIDPRHPLFVSLNPLDEPESDLVYATFDYDHPVYDASAIGAQGHISTLQGRHRSWFCGSYCGYGFHEDALRSGLDVAAALGCPAPWATTAVDSCPAGTSALRDAA